LKQVVLKTIGNTLVFDFVLEISIVLRFCFREIKKRKTKPIRAAQTKTKTILKLEPRAEIACPPLEEICDLSLLLLQ
jgi:hypothetical protein